MIQSLQKTGILHLQNYDETMVSELLKTLGKVIQITDVKVSPHAKGLVNTERGLGFHTDHHKAKYILWHCLEQTDKGGESILINAREVYAQLTDNQKDILRKVNLHEHKVFEDDVESMPLVRMIENEPHFYYSFWLLEKEMKEEQKEAVQAFENALKNSSFQEIKLQRNEVLIIDNQFILHGRKAILGSKNRYLKRYWIA